MTDWSKRTDAVFGVICKYGHDHGGGSYRYRGGACVECRHEYSKKRFSTHGAQIKATLKARRVRNPDEHREANARWRARHPDVIKDWKKRNAGRVASLNAARRARKKEALPCWADKAAIARIYEEASARTCSTGIQYHVDHIIPLSHGAVCGLHVPANLCIIPAVHNLKKNNRFSTDWI